ncbi:MAG TPA: tRNA pseudouridine(13) synthase TruD [Polyangia bacterium]|nr:tRNA pseudouridine(13) synthase TruD [Polyangia bacterium]
MAAASEGRAALTFTPSPERFVVEEIAAYAPVGEGEHTYLWIEKRGLTTMDAVRRLARLLDVDARDIGYAGLKDRNAVTRQWVSVPRVDPERARQVSEPDLTVLEVSRHGNKLRTGHLRGNRFELVVSVPRDEGADANVADALRARVLALAASGVPNRYGEQRFGAAGDNAAAGLAILRGARRERDHRLRKLLLSAAQSAVFNRALELRAARPGGLGAVLAGDVLQKVESGGLFISEDVAVDQPRVDAGELVVTGPLPGGREKEPPPGSPARAVEDEAIAALGATREDFERAGRDLPGARRPFVVPLALGDPPVQPEPSLASPGEAAFRLRFSLPAGSYATVVVAALASA